MAYPELVSRGVSKSRKCKWLMKVGASNGVIPSLKKSWPGGGGFRATRKPPWIRHCIVVATSTSYYNVFPSLSITICRTLIERQPIVLLQSVISHHLSVLFSIHQGNISPLFSFHHSHDHPSFFFSSVHIWPTFFVSFYPLLPPPNICLLLNPADSKHASP